MHDGNAVESRGEEAADELRTEDLLADMNDTAAHCSVQSEIAQMCESGIKDLKICQFMEAPHRREHDGKGDLCLTRRHGHSHH